MERSRDDFYVLNKLRIPDQQRVCQSVFCDTGVKYVYRWFVILFAQLASKFAKSANKHISFLQPDLSLQVA